MGGFEIMNKQEKIKRLTIRVPESIHHKLRLIALLQQTSVTGAVRYLVEKETLEQSAVIKDLLNSIGKQEAPSKAIQRKRLIDL
jgi:hypothetical protein